MNRNMIDVNTSPKDASNVESDERFRGPNSENFPAVSGYMYALTKISFPKPSTEDIKIVQLSFFHRRYTYVGDWQRTL
jgi:hypothetical protein